MSPQTFIKLPFIRLLRPLGFQFSDPAFWAADSRAAWVKRCIELKSSLALVVKCRNKVGNQIIWIYSFDRTVSAVKIWMLYLLKRSRVFKVASLKIVITKERLLRNIFFKSWLMFSGNLLFVHKKCEQLKLNLTFMLIIFIWSPEPLFVEPPSKTLVRSPDSEAQSGPGRFWQNSENISNDHLSKADVKNLLNIKKKKKGQPKWRASSRSGSAIGRHIWIWTASTERLWPIKRGNDLSEACSGEKCQSENGRKYVSDKEKAALVF